MAQGDDLAIYRPFPGNHTCSRASPLPAPASSARHSASHALAAALTVTDAGHFNKFQGTRGASEAPGAAVDGADGVGHWQQLQQGPLPTAGRAQAGLLGSLGVATKCRCCPCADRAFQPLGSGPAVHCNVQGGRQTAWLHTRRRLGLAVPVAKQLSKGGSMKGWQAVLLSRRCSDGHVCIHPPPTPC